MSQGQDPQRPERAEELPKQEFVAPDAPSGSSNDEMDDERRIIQALVTNPEDEINFLEEIKKMLKNNDPRLTYMFRENFIKNPLIPDRATQLGCLMDLLCEKKAYGKYKCTKCGKEYNNLDEMHQHLLRHSKCRFYFCVQCLEGCNTLTDMVHHRKTTHGDAVEPPLSIQEVLRRMRRREGLEPPQPSRAEELEDSPPGKGYRLEHRCSVCGSTFDYLDVVLSHTIQEHPNEREVISRLRVRFLRAALNPNADEEEDALNPAS